MKGKSFSFSAWKPILILLRITIMLCCIMIVLCMALIAYDILVLIDPTRCFFLNCDDASVDISNSTHHIVVTGWPLHITWPDYFQRDMNAKRIFQSLQILCATLFILFTSLYLLTYVIYRHIRLRQQSFYNANNYQTLPAYETNRASPLKYSNGVYEYNSPHQTTMYTNKGQAYTSGKDHYLPTIVLPVTERKMSRNEKIERSSQVPLGLNGYARLCIRCNLKPRMILVTYYEQKYFFPHLCINCNHELAIRHRKPRYTQSKITPIWRP